MHQLLLRTDNAVFPITSNIEPPFKTIEVTYIPTEILANNFLDLTAGAAGQERTQMITFEQANSGSWTAPLRSA